MIPQCVTLWIGDRLSSIERACLKSVVRQGHPLALYCYDEPEGVPDGVELRAAESVLPREQIYFHRGSVAPFSDWFRYELQERRAGIWLDTDVYLLSPIGLDGDYLFGEESRGMINNGVLSIPAGSEMLRRLLTPFRDRRPPSWMPQRTLLQSLFHGGRPAEDPRTWPRGIMGPTGLTEIARALDLTSKARPPEVFHPVHWSHSDWIRNPDLPLEAMVTPRTVAVHLWNERIAAFKDKPAPRSSFLYRLQAEGAQ